MRLIEDKQYYVEVLEGSLFFDGAYIWYFRYVLISKEGFPIFVFSESLDEWSVFYNLFIPDDKFIIQEL